MTFGCDMVTRRVFSRLQNEAQTRCRSPCWPLWFHDVHEGIRHSLPGRGDTKHVLRTPSRRSSAAMAAGDRTFARIHDEGLAVRYAQRLEPDISSNEASDCTEGRAWQLPRLSRRAGGLATLRRVRSCTRRDKHAVPV